MTFFFNNFNNKYSYFGESLFCGSHYLFRFLSEISLILRFVVIVTVTVSRIEEEVEFRGRRRRRRRTGKGRPPPTALLQTLRFTR